MTVAYFLTAWRMHVYCFARGPESLRMRAPTVTSVFTGKTCSSSQSCSGSGGKGEATSAASID